MRTMTLGRAKALATLRQLSNQGAYRRETCGRDVICGLDMRMDDMERIEVSVETMAETGAGSGEWHCDLATVHLVNKPSFLHKHG
jgi:hypothetical protein